MDSRTDGKVVQVAREITIEAQDGSGVLVKVRVPDRTVRYDRRESTFAFSSWSDMIDWLTELEAFETVSAAETNEGGNSDD